MRRWSISYEYPACRNIANQAAKKAGAKIVVASLPFPCPGPEAVVNAVLAAVTDRTGAWRRSAT